MTDNEAKQIVKAAASVLLEVATDAIYEDPHQWSARPCATCRFVSGIIGKPFGCIKFNHEQRGRN